MSNVKANTKKPKRDKYTWLGVRGTDNKSQIYEIQCRCQETQFRHFPRKLTISELV